MRLRPLTKDEIIEKYRLALEKYADANNWQANRFLVRADINFDDCSGNFLNNGELARQALLYNENTSVAE